MAGEWKSLPEDPGRTHTTEERPPSVAGRTSTLAEAHRGGVKAHSSPLEGQRPGGSPPFGPHRVERVGSSACTRAGGTPAGMGTIRPTEALSLEEDERQPRELQRAVGVTPEVGTRAQWH